MRIFCATWQFTDRHLKQTHCDIVAEVRPNELVIIGGNVGSAVEKQRIHTNDAGFIESTGGIDDFFAVIRIRTDL